MINVTKKQGYRIEGDGEGGCHLKQDGQGRLCWEGGTWAEPGRRWQVSHVDTWRSTAGRGDSKCKGPETGAGVGLGNSKHQEWLEQHAWGEVRAWRERGRTSVFTLSDMSSHCRALNRRVVWSELLLKSIALTVVWRTQEGKSGSRKASLRLLWKSRWREDSGSAWAGNGWWCGGGRFLDIISRWSLQDQLTGWIRGEREERGSEVVGPLAAVLAPG